MIQQNKPKRPAFYIASVNIATEHFVCVWPTGVGIHKGPTVGSRRL